MKERSSRTRRSSLTSHNLLAASACALVGHWGAALAAGERDIARLNEAANNEVRVLAGASSFAGVVAGPSKVATVCHRLAGAVSYELQATDGRRHAARLAAADQDRNVCILQADDLSLPASVIGEAQSSDQTKVVGVLVEKNGLRRFATLQVNYMGKVVDGIYLGLVASLLSEDKFEVRDGAPVYDWRGKIVGVASTDVSGPSSTIMVLPVEWIAQVSSRMTRPDVPLTANAWMNQARAYDARGDRSGLLRNNLRWTEERPRSAWAWNNLGNAYIFSREEEKLSKAKAAFQRAVELDPQLASAWSNLGNAYADSRETVRAIDAYRQATRIDPTYSLAWKNLANLYIKNGQRQEAASTLKLAANAGKGSERARALNDLALVQDNPKEAAETLRLAAAETPDDPLIWNSLGVAFGKAGELEKSIRAYEVAVRLGPRFLSPWMNLSGSYMQAGKPEEALQALRMVTAIDPKYGLAWKWQGVLVADYERDYKRAIVAFLEAAKNGEKAADLWSALGLAYSQDGQLEKAEESYRKGIEREPDGALLWARLVWLYLSQGRIDDAAQAADESTKRAPLSAMSWHSVGLVKQRQIQRPQAIAAYRQAVKIDPSMIASWVNLGTELNEVGQYNEAKGAAHRALSLDPRSRAAENTLGVSYIRSKEFPSAIDLFERLAKGDPKDALALANLTVAYRRSGQLDQAQDAHRRLQALDPSIAQRVFDEEFRSKRGTELPWDIYVSAPF